MLLPYRWLQQYTDVTWSPAELADRLTMSGMEVASVHEPMASLEQVVVGAVEQVATHPQHDRLLVCRVDVGDRLITLVTAAQNVQAGMKVPVALPGARLGAQEVEIRPTEFDGVVSEGMLCSERELGIGDDASGIMELPPDVSVGHDLVVELGLDDSVLEIDVYANRPDCQSVIGMAREVAALTRGNLSVPQPDIPAQGHGPAVEVRVDAYDLCPRFCARVVHGVQIAPSPAWLQTYLRLAGMRPINNVVDITNFVMLEMGQPLHAYDLALLSGPEINVRRARPGETMKTLDGIERPLTEEMLVIADAKQAVGIAGIMGGESTEISNSTQDILLEAANFNAASIRRTSRKLGLQSEASLRFEKGLDPHLPAKALARAADLLAQLAGGRISPSVSDVYEQLPSETCIQVRPERVNALLGTDLAVGDMKWMLRALQFPVEVTDAGLLNVTVPSFRPDVTREVDLIEEIARLHGFENIEPTLPRGSSAHGRQAEHMNQFDQLRQRLSGAGLDEVMTYSFMSPNSLERLALSDTDPATKAIPILNPLSEDLSLLRTTLLPNLLELLSRNMRRQAAAVHAYEIGSVFLPESLPLESQPAERPTLAIGLIGEAVRGGWGTSERTVDFYDLKGLVEATIETLGVQVSIEPASHPALHPGRSAAVIFEEQQIGVFGEVHPEVTERFELHQRAYVAELNLEPLLGHQRTPIAEPIPRHPAIRRDLALLAPDNVPAEKIARIIQRSGEPLLRGIQLFDVYQGAQVPAGYRSLAYSLEWQAAGRTLTDQEIAAVQERILSDLEECGVKVRS